MAHYTFVQTRRQAKEDLTLLESQIDDLSRQRDALQAVVSSLESYLLMAEPTQLESEPQFDEQRAAPSEIGLKPAWVIARDVLAQNGTPMAVPAIHQGMVSMGYTVKPDAIRVAMIRKPDIFVNQGNGVYALSGWLPVEFAEESDPVEHFSLQEMREAHPEARADW